MGYAFRNCDYIKTLATPGKNFRHISKSYGVAQGHECPPFQPPERGIFLDKVLGFVEPRFARFSPSFITVSSVIWMVYSTTLLGQPLHGKVRYILARGLDAWKYIIGAPVNIPSIKSSPTDTHACIAGTALASPFHVVDRM